MMKSWPFFVIFIFALVLAACAPSTVEPGVTATAVAGEPTPAPLPEDAVSTAVSPTPPSLPLPLHPDMAPESLPVYIMARDPIPADEESALTWAQSFGLANAEVVEGNDEMIRVMSREEATGSYEELTFLQTAYEAAIIYSRGSEVQFLGEATPTPTLVAAIPPLPADLVQDVALEFVREHGLLPEPIVAHEYPSFDDRHTVHVATALNGYRQTDLGDEPGVTVRIDGNGRITSARIIPATFAAAETVAVRPLEQLYPDFLTGAIQHTMFYERAQSGRVTVDDFARFQAHSLPYGDRGDRAELVYAPLPTQPERFVPMWLLTRPYEQTWDHYVEYYLSAAAGEEAPRPMPTRTPLGQTGVEPETLRIVPPLLVDGENGRLYTNAAVDGITHTVSLDAATGNLLTVFGLTGELALDTGRALLYVDKHPYGLTVIDTTTGEAVNDIQLPPGERNSARPHADPAGGNVLVFRDQMLLVTDPLSETWQQTAPFIVEGTVCGEAMEEPPTIQQTWYDADARLLYLAVTDYVCTPWFSYTVIVYDMAAMTEVARYPGTYYLSGAAVNGRFYGKSWFRLGKTFQWAWQDGQPWLEQTERGEDFVGAFSGFQVDAGRGLLYESTVDGLQILEMKTMAVVKTMPAPVNGRLEAYDPVTDNLYFVAEDGRLHIWSAADVQP